MPALEKKKADLESQLNSGEAAHAQLTEWSKEIKSISNQLDELEMRWLELSVED